MVVSSCKLVVCSWMKAIVAVASTIALTSTPTTTAATTSTTTTTTAATTSTTTTTTVIRRDTPSEESSPNMNSSISGWSVQDDEYDGDDDNDGDNGNEYDGDDHEEEEQEEHFASTPLPCLHRIEVSYSTVPIPYHHISSQSSYQSILHPSRTPVMSLLLEALQTDRVDCQLLLGAFELDEDL